MDTMTLTINLPKDIGAALENKAKTSGTGVAEYVETMIAAQIKRPTFRDLFSDVRKNIAVSDEDLEKQVDIAIAKSREARLKE